jgi:hypothetical protein
MWKRWSLWLMTTHVLLMALLFTIEEPRLWPLYERFPRLPVDSRPTPQEDTFTWGMAMEIRLSVGQKTFAITEMPVALLFGIFGNASFERPLISPHDWPVIRNRPTTQRVAFVDTLLLVLVGLMWWGIGMLIDRGIRFYRPIRAASAVISACGLILLALSILPGHIRYIDMPIIFTLAVSLLGWMFLAGVLILSAITRLFTKRPVTS